MSLGRVLPDAAARFAERPAIVDVGRTWTFAEADADAGRIAQALLELGVRPGERVGVTMYKCGEGFLAMHGVVRAGAVAVPLDPASPVGRLEAICSLMDIGVIVTHEARTPAVVELAGRVELTGVLGSTAPIDRVPTRSWPDIGGLEPIAPADVALDAPAYIITTSGSTGEPKGITHSHRSALAYANASAVAFDVGPEDRIADIAPSHFDISTFALWVAPLRGAAIIVMPEAHQRLPASLSQRLADERVTVWYSVPFLLQQLLFRGDLANRDLGHLRLAKLGGEVLAPEAVAALMELAPSVRVANVYGPAETNQCCHHVMTEPPPSDRPVPIGGPWSAAELRIAPVGATSPGPGDRSTGDLWVSAETTMLGYFERPELDAERFAVVDGRRWFRTGDLVSTDVDGRLVFDGRVDHQVKVRGYRIELEAVEAELEKLDHVESVVAAVDRDAQWGDRIVIGVVEAGPDFSADRFLAAARAVLPAYAAPAQILTLSDVRLTGSGKLDRRALREQVVAALGENPAPGGDGGSSSGEDENALDAPMAGEDIVEEAP